MKKTLNHEKNEHDKTKNELIELLKEQKSHKIINNTVNYNNINIFLQDKCKDALNIEEFLEQIVFKLHDLEYTKNNGLCDGLTSIFVKGLKELGTFKRPLHCTDLKKEIMYIKNNDKWSKELSEQSLKESITTLADKQRKSVKVWRDANPFNSDKDIENYTSLMSNIHDDDKNPRLQGKIIKNLNKISKLDTTNLP